MSVELQRRIVSWLSESGSATIGELSNALGEENYNKIETELLRLKNVGIAREYYHGRRRFWSLIDMEGPRKDKVIVFVDLGNVHDCLKKCEKYRKHEKIDAVFAFADRNYNGYGINPKPQLYGKDPNVQIFQATDTHRNAADTILIWECQRIVAKSAATIHFIVCTKDQGFATLATLVREEGHSMEFVRNKDDLKTAITRCM